ncbi:MAG: hypothetical protein AAB680_06045 [Pseudomonadota bacterium]
MKKHSITKLSLAGLVLVASCATEAPQPAPPPPPPPPPVVKAPPPPFIPNNAPASEHVRSLYNMAGLFPAFAEEARRAALNENIINATQIANSIDRAPLLARSETIDGAKAYSILAASMSAEFRAGITEIGTPMGREAFIARLISDPSFVKTIPGYGNAKELGAAAFSSRLQIITQSAVSLNQASYDLQRQAWTRTAVAKEPRLTALATSWNTPLQVTNFDGTNIATNGNSAQVINDRVMAAAALYIIRADQEMIEMLQLGSGRSCAFRAYLNVRQCMSASKFPYEHTFCLSKHAQEEVKVCMTSEVGYPPPPPPPIVHAAAPIPKAKTTKTKAKKKR